MEDRKGKRSKQKGISQSISKSELPPKLKAKADGHNSWETSNSNRKPRGESPFLGIG